MQYLFQILSGMENSDLGLHSLHMPACQTLVSEILGHLSCFRTKCEGDKSMNSNNIRIQIKFLRKATIMKLSPPDIRSYLKNKRCGTNNEKTKLHTLKLQQLEQLWDH